MKGIMFKPDMHKAIMEGRKTVTRRLDGLKEINEHPGEWYRVMGWGGCEDFLFGTDARKLFKAGAFLFTHHPTCDSTLGVEVKPRYRVGEVVYVKEAYSHYGNTFNAGVSVANLKYRDGVRRGVMFSDNDPPPETWWNTGKLLTHFQTPFFMPAWAARTFLEIVSVRPERLNEITLEECLLEGYDMERPESSTSWYAHLWDSINPKHPWASNPWLWRIAFKVVEKP